MKPLAELTLDTGATRIVNDIQQARGWTCKRIQLLRDVTDEERHALELTLQTLKGELLEYWRPFRHVASYQDMRPGALVKVLHGFTPYDVDLVDPESKAYAEWQYQVVAEFHRHRLPTPEKYLEYRRVTDSGHSVYWLEPISKTRDLGPTSYTTYQGFSDGQVQVTSLPKNAIVCVKLGDADTGYIPSPEVFEQTTTRWRDALRNRPDVQVMVTTHHEKVDVVTSS